MGLTNHRRIEDRTFGRMIGEVGPKASGYYAFSRRQIGSDTLLQCPEDSPVDR